MVMSLEAGDASRQVCDGDSGCWPGYSVTEPATMGNIVLAGNVSARDASD